MSEDSKYHWAILGFLQIGVVLISLKALHIIKLSWIWATLPFWIIPAFFAFFSVATLVGSLITGWWTPFGSDTMAYSRFRSELKTK